jgi:RNA-directed DNA polymerase
MKLIQNEKTYIFTVFSALNSTNQLCYLLNYVSKEILKSNDSFDEAEISYFSDRQNILKYYQKFKIKKKNGLFRPITSPFGKLKHLQQCFNVILKSIYQPHESAFGFTDNLSIIDNAKIHTNKEYVFNIDLKDFFSTITINKIVECLEQAPFNLNSKHSSFKENLARFIAEISCTSVIDDGPLVLPQGSPLSPMLSNIVCQSLDESLLILSQKHQVSYSRYADDISFSGDKNIFSLSDSFFVELKQLIKEAGFLINFNKTRLQNKKYRQEVTGLIVNEKVNIRKKYIKEIRMWLYLWKNYGYEKANQIFQKSANNENTKPNLHAVLSGKLNFLRMVKGENNATYCVLKQKMLSLDTTNKYKLIVESLNAYIETLSNKEKGQIVSEFMLSNYSIAIAKWLENFYPSEDIQLFLEQLQPYANGMNLNKNGKFVEVNFTKDLPFNNIGNWKNPIFTILSDNDIGAENSNVTKLELIDAKLKIKAKLDELKKTNLKYYNILIDQATFFTAFTTDTGEIFIKPIILRKFNNNKESQTKYPLELQNQVFDENGKYIKGQAKLLGKKYSFFAFDNNKNGQSVRLKFIENEFGQLNVAFIVFSDRTNVEPIDYYLNNLTKKEFETLLNREKLTRKPILASYRDKTKFPKELNFFNLTIIERIKENASKLLDGTYKIRNVNNPNSIFQNVGLRLKFKEKQEEDDFMVASTSPSIVQTTEAPKVKSTYTLQEISDYVWNNFKFGKNSGSGWIYTVYELKNDLDISELNRRFLELKRETKQTARVKHQFCKDFTNKREINDFVKRGDIPSERAFLE